MHARTLASPRSHGAMYRVHRILLIVLAVLFALLALGSCATRYQVRMRGIQLDPERKVAGDSAMCVEKLPELAPDDRDEVVEAKLSFLLERDGFTVGSCTDADFVVLYKAETVPVAARSTIGPPTSSKGGLTISTKGGPFQKIIDLHIVVAGPFVKDGSEQVVWSGTAVMPEVPNTSPRFENMLLVEAFEHFAQDTGVIITSKVGLNDDEAQRLHRLDPSSMR